MLILKKGHQPGVYVPLRALFLVAEYFKVKLNWQFGTQKYARKRIQHKFWESMDKSVPRSSCFITFTAKLSSDR